MRRHPRRTLAAVLAASAMTAATVLTAGTSGAAASAEAPGSRSLAQVLAADGNRFDRKPGDFDILERAVLLVIEQRPDSRIALLADGERRLTGFLPTDLAFRRLVQDVAGVRPGSERETFQAVRSLGVDTVKEVLLYHLVVGRTLTSPKVLDVRGSRVRSASGDSFRVTVRQGAVFLGDRDPDDPNPRVTVLDINRGNLQVGHAIDRVLRPVDL